MALLLRSGAREACPICGAPNGACKPGDPPRVTVIRDTDYEVRLDGTVIMGARHRFKIESSRWRSTMDVLAQVGDKKFERRYAAGDFLPLVEALSQGLVSPDQVTEADKDELRRHVAEGRVTLDQVREALVMAKKQKKPKNRMVGSDAVVQKAMDDDAEEILAGVS